MPTSSSAQALVLQDFFAGTTFYSVPSYQREYSWGPSEAGQLLEDLFSILSERKANGGPNTSYFLGSIVMVEPTAASNEGQETSWRRLDVVDGQQRLITLTILLGVLRDLFDEDGDEAMARGLRGLIEMPSGSPQPYRLSLRSSDATFFEQLIQEPGACTFRPDKDELSDPHVRMLDNRSKFLSEMAQLSEHDRRDFTQFLLGACETISITTPDVDNAFQIYLTLNHRGLPLTRGNILKAKLIGSLVGEARDRVNHQWDTWQRSMGDRQFDAMFGYIRTIHGRPSVHILRENLIVAENQGGAQNYIDEILAPYVDAMNWITEAPQSVGTGAEPVRRYVTYLSWLRNADWVPPALLWLRSNPNIEEQGNFFKSLDRLAYGLLLLGLGHNGRTARYRKVLEAIRSGRPHDSENSPFRLTIREQRNILYNISNDLHRRSKQTCKLLLLRLSHALPDEQDTMLKFASAATVEHVLPQRPGRNGKWLEWFPNNDERHVCTGRLANMVLVTKRQNEVAKNKDFGEKKEIFFPENRPSPFALTNYLMERDRWTPFEIDAREDELMALVKAMWDLQGPAGRELDR